MTLESIAKGLAKSWKTSTGWAISTLSLVIFAFSLFPGVSLSGLSTFGLLFIALQALEFTKEQASEWRRKDALNHCYEAESLYNKIKPIIDTQLNTAFEHHDRECIAYWARQSIKDCSLDSSRITNRLESSIKMIDVHLKEMDKEPITPLSELLFHMDCNIMLLDLYSHDSSRGYTERIEIIFEETREIAKKIGINNEISASNALDSYIHSLKYMVAEK